MSRETSETGKGYRWWEEGKRAKFVVEKVEKYNVVSKKGNNLRKYQFSFKVEFGNEWYDYQEGFLVFLVGDLLRALGCQETKSDVFDWDTEEVCGKEVWATMGKNGDYCKMEKITAKSDGEDIEIPFLDKPNTSTGIPF